MPERVLRGVACPYIKPGVIGSYYLVDVGGRRLRFKGGDGVLAERAA